ncbi:MAG TPA: hypothetical protein VMI92_13840 [Steroidobacteraceae bacterium]|nr:hypothetical protein [Steroidobacteraceae bacterium]
MSDTDPKDKPGRPPGGVRHDGRGNAVWQWAAESGRHLMDSTSRLLKRLEVPGLSVEGDEPEQPKQRKASGYNPYETTQGAANPRGAGPRPPASGAAGRQPPAQPPAAAKQPAAGQAPARSLPPAVKPSRSWLGKMFNKD